MQELDGPEEKTGKGDELSLFLKRWKPSTYTTEPLKEVIIPEPSSTALKQKVTFFLKYFLV